jgi:hypothetical protein
MRRPVLTVAVLATIVLVACHEGANETLAAPAPPTPTAPSASPSTATATAPPPSASAASPTPPPTATPAGTSPPPSTATAPNTPAPQPPPSVSALVRAAVALEPSGARLPLQGNETVVDPGATFRVELGATVADVRLVLLDHADAIVPASETREVADATALTLAPAAPLVPASRYTLRLDGARERELHDAAGHAFTPMALSILVAGEPPPPEPKKAAPKKKRRAR